MLSTSQGRYAPLPTADPGFGDAGGSQSLPLNYLQSRTSSGGCAEKGSLPAGESGESGLGTVDGDRVPRSRRRSSPPLLWPCVGNHVSAASSRNGSKELGVVMEAAPYVGMPTEDVQFRSWPTGSCHPSAANSRAGSKEQDATHRPSNSRTGSKEQDAIHIMQYSNLPSVEAGFSVAASKVEMSSTAPHSRIGSKESYVPSAHDGQVADGPLLGRDPRYRPELDFDGSGQVDEFEIYFANILDEAKEGKKVDLTDDVWGCAILTTVSDLPVILSGQLESQNIVRFAYISLISLLNLTLQFCLLYWISIYVMFPSMKFSQDIYSHFHHNFFSADGHFNKEQFSSFSRVGELCQFPLFDRWFTCAVLFLWCSQCFIEIRNSERILSGLMSIPLLPWGIPHTLMIHEGLHDTESRVQLEKVTTTLAGLQHRHAAGDLSELTDAVKKLHDLVSDKYVSEQTYQYLVCLTPLTRLSIFVLVLVPRMVIILLLMSLGCVWLTATDRFSDLILNALALEFVVNIDNLLFNMFFPASLHHEVDCLKLAIPAHAISQDMPTTPKGAGLADKEKAARDKRGYYRSLMYLITVTAFVYVFQRFQPVIPGFEHDLHDACKDYISAWSSPKYGVGTVSEIVSCILGRSECFPYASSGSDRFDDDVENEEESKE